MTRCKDGSLDRRSLLSSWGGISAFVVLQGGCIIQQLRAKTGASIKVREAFVAMPRQPSGSQQRLGLRVIAISQSRRCVLWDLSCQGSGQGLSQWLWPFQLALWNVRRPSVTTVLGLMPECRNDDGRCAVEAAALAVLDCIFAATESASPQRVAESSSPAGTDISATAQAANKGGDGLPFVTVTVKPLTDPGGGAAAGIPAAVQDPPAQARLLVSQYAAGLIVGAAACDSTNASIEALDLPKRLDEKLVVISGSPSAVRPKVVNVIGL